ncbi:type II toxin-antitoxin system PemK/MazF family toxin [Gemmata sp. G18]|uniref:Type II toxin-antitoxin system PemK/MazF family toxin n=1 Tax=Gemmata palustris TaxID=2822762 RepID=A0ABS5BZD7_9BACT|nr:type II toxin-antitoxin system PemK/MazF family toxin [Gemmata palustris]MBP3959091.1 type II toxin-antitoxin system PemK/MazF family toxin [Gemmata palustris]
MSSPLQQGRIVWVELLDPQGRNPKRRPTVVLTPTAEIHPEGEVVVAALSSQTDQSPPNVSVEVPWHRDGHPRTKLNRRNVVVCSWLVVVPVAALGAGDLGGIVPFAEMARILEIVRAIQGGPANQTPPETEPNS